MLVWKSGLTAVLLILLLVISFMEDQSSPNTLAAVFALTGATVLFVRLIPGEGPVNEGIEYLLALAGAFAAFWAGWF